MRIKELETKGVKVVYYNKNNYKNTIHGKLTHVSKDRIIVMEAVPSEKKKGESFEHVILRNKIIEIEEINYNKITQTTN